MTSLQRNLIVFFLGLGVILLLLLAIPGFRGFLATTIISGTQTVTTQRALTLTVPEDAEPGSHTFHISWEDRAGDPANPPSRLAQSQEVTVNITTPVEPPAEDPTPTPTPPLSTTTPRGPGNPPIVTTPTSTPTPTPKPQCSDGQDNDNDLFVNAADSGCHTDGNPNNPNSYDPADNSESSGPLTQCSDSIDNDGDGLVDGGDPQCHTDGLANNPASYDSSIDQEAAPTPPPVAPDPDPTPTPTPEPDPTPEPTPTLTSTGGGGGGGGDEGGDVGPDPEQPSLRTFTFQGEFGHSFNQFARAMSDGAHRVLALFHERASADKKINVPNGDYWLFLNAKHDVPGPVDVGIYVNGWPWRAIRLDRNDNSYRTHAVGKLRDFSGGTIRYRFLKDKFDTVDPELDRNLFIDWWQLTEHNSPQGVGAGSQGNSPGRAILPRLNSIIREVLGTQHVNIDVWYFYAPRLVAPATAPEAITSEAQLRRIMNYWKNVSPERPRGI